EPSVVPRPVSMQLPDAPGFVLGDGAVVAADAPLTAVAARLVEELGADTGLRLDPDSTADAAVTLGLDSAIDAPEGYRLDIDAHGIRLTAGTPAGAYAGLQSLRQLVPLGAEGADRMVPAVSIRDEPRFAYRSAMLDVARHFFPVDEVK